MATLYSWPVSFFLLSDRSGVHEMFPSSTDIKDGAGYVLMYCTARTEIGR
jgi:hypothetical protein